MMATRPAPAIHVLAGPNGGGKSSIGGVLVREFGGEYYNPDEATQKLAIANPHLSFEEANALAWQIGKERLGAAIASRSSFAFETTLGGNTITDLLRTTRQSGMELHIWYIALESADAHVARVQARVAAGGHDIPVDKIRSRYDSSRLNLVRLLPVATSVRVFDNSFWARANYEPRPTLLLEVQQGRIVYVLELTLMPEWAKPIVTAALREDLRIRTTDNAP